MYRLILSGVSKVYNPWSAVQMAELWRMQTKKNAAQKSTKGTHGSTQYISISK